jgi:hypothetical protein
MMLNDMALRITVDVFSGRPNPVVVLEGTEAEEALERLRPARKLDPEAPGHPPEFILGYRGLVVEQTDKQRVRGLPRLFRVANGDLFGPRLAARAADPDFETSLLAARGAIQRLELGSRFSSIVLKQVRELERLRAETVVKRTRWPTRPVCRCAPLYEPTWWNDGGQRQVNNNCYNYATDYRSDTFAQPGQAAGAMYSALTCASVRPAAERDQLISDPDAENRCPQEGHLVALVIWPGWAKVSLR